MQLGRLLLFFAAAFGVGGTFISGCGGGKGGGQTGSRTNPQGISQGALGSACLSDRDCTADRLVCDLSRNICVDCVTTSQCAAGQVCLDGVCAGASSCSSSADCRTSPSEPICDSGRCVECARDNDCAGLGEAKTCVGNRCRKGCGADNDCPTTHFCSHGACMPTVCYGDQSKACLYDQLLTCTANGAGYVAASCTEGCDSSGGDARCKNDSVSASGGTGGAPVTDTHGAGGSADTQTGAGTGGNVPVVGGTGGSPGSSGPAASCQGVSPANGDPCATIPAFTGTQVVDGSGDEFCSIPAKVIDLSNAGYKDPAGVQDTATQAIVRVAWSTAALHAHVHVNTGSTGNIVQGNPNLYDGDNVQFFISGGQTNGSSDGTSQIFIGPPSGAAPGKSNLASGNASYEWSARAVAGGYEVELRWPWSSSPGAAPAAGKRIGLYVLIGVSGAGGREVEYGFALASASSTGCTSQGKPPQAWCDSSLWCTPTLQ